MTRDKAGHAVSDNEGGKELSALNVKHMGCIEQSKVASIKATRDSAKGRGTMF